MPHKNFHIQTTGRLSDDVLSMLTHGQVSLHFEGEEFGVVWTKHGPLTQGKGDGELAGIEDVTVYVDGSEVNVVGINPVQGSIVLEDPVPNESEVKIDYFYTENPPLDLKNFSQQDVTFASSTFQGSRFFYDSYFSDSPLQTRSQPKQIEYFHTAWESNYTTTFNDPTVARFNQQIYSSSIPPFSYDLERIDIEFEGQNHPTDSKEWSYKGPPLPSNPDIEDGLYVIDDHISSHDNISGQPAYFFSDQEFEYPTITTLNYRFKSFSIDQKDGHFTGIGAGWAGNEDIILSGFLKEDGNFYGGLLSKKGDESNIQSWIGLEGSISSEDDKILLLDEDIDLEENDKIRVNGEVVSVVSVEGEEVELSSNPNASLGSTVEIFPLIDPSDLTSYRLSEREDNVVRLYTSDKNVVAKAKRSDLARNIEIFQELEPNQFFFGSISRKAKSRSGWDFYRAVSIPTRENIQGRNVQVQNSFGQNPPESPPNSWIVNGNQGFWGLTGKGELLTEQATSSSGLLGFHRIEPFLTKDAVVDLTTNVKVESWAKGFPAHISFADERKEVTLGLFSPEPSNQPTANIGYSGVESFQNAGWSETNENTTSLSFTDHFTSIEYDGSDVYETSQVEDVSPDFVNSPSDFLFAFRTQIEDYQLNSDDQVAQIIGVDNGDRWVGVRFAKSGIQFVDKSGSHLFASSIDNEEWKDGDFHSYRVAVSSGNVSLFVDEEYQESKPLTSFPSGNRNNEEYEVFLQMKDETVTSNIDYLFSHDLHYASASEREIGIYTGGDRFDINSYETAQFDWISDSLPIRIHHNNSEGVKVYLDQAQSPEFHIPYESLPNRKDRSYLNTSLGFVEFGSLESESFSRVKWDGIGYNLENQQEDQSSLQTSRFNRAEPDTSPEPAFDEDPEQVKYLSSTENIIPLNQRGYNVKNVLQVKSEDGTTTYDFTFNKDQNRIEIENGSLPDKHTTVVVTFYVEEPYSEEYIRNQEAQTVLYEGTPYFAQSNQAQVETKTEWVTQFNDPEDTFNDDDDSWFNDTRQRVAYSLSSELCPFYKDLDVIRNEVSGESSLLAPAYDKETFREFSLDGFEEDYILPSPVNPGFAKNFSPIEHDDTVDDFENTSQVFDSTFLSSNESEVRGEIFRQESESYSGPNGQLLDGELKDFDGAILFDVPAYQMDDTSGEDGYGEMDTYSSTTTTVTFNSTINWP